MGDVRLASYVFNRPQSLEVPEMIAHCTSCGNRFDVKMEEIPQPDGGIKIAFDCDCGKRYEVAKLSKRALFLREEYHRSLRRYGNDRKTRRLLERYQRLYVGLSETNA